MAQTVKSDKNSGKSDRDSGKRGKAPSSPSSAGDGSSKVFILGVLAILVAGLAAVALVVTNREGVDLDAPQTAPVEIDGTPLESIPDTQGGVSIDGATDPAIGTEPPEVSGTDFDGSEVSITDDGRAKVIYFLAHWCNHCQEEVPRIVDLIDQGRQPENLDIYGVSTAIAPERGNYPPSRWFDVEGFQPPVIRDSEDTEAYVSFGPSGFPYAVYVNADNEIVARTAGQLDEATMEALWGLTAGVSSADAVDADAGTGQLSEPEVGSSTADEE